MRFDLFFSISQTPVDGYTPSEAEMFRNFLAEVEAADRLGYGTAWVAESHLSSQVQKTNARPVIPHWEGEVGLNADILQLAHAVYGRTKRIELGSAVMNILTAGGPVAHAERVATFLALHGLDPDERRKINVGFAAGRFEFMNRPYGVAPRDAVEEAAWPALKGRVFAEAAEIFVRLLRGDVLSSDDVRATCLTRADFRTDEEWRRVQEAAGTRAERVAIPRRYVFEALKVVPQEFRRDLLRLYVGSHDPALQEEVNAFSPVRVFNLSITRPEVIDETHRRMERAYHPAGGAWRRWYMPRTVFVFLGRTRALAQERARAALSAYWAALDGTIDPKKVENAADNALVGDAADVARQARERFHPDDRLMLWFDFFDHDAARVIGGMEEFMADVAPRVSAA